jgi:hypothetical protein
MSHFFYIKASFDSVGDIENTLSLLRLKQTWLSEKLVTSVSRFRLSCNGDNTSFGLLGTLGFYLQVDPPTLKTK